MLQFLSMSYHSNNTKLSKTACELLRSHAYKCTMKLVYVLPGDCSLVVTCRQRANLLVFLYLLFSCVFYTFPCGVLGQVWYLIVSIPDICPRGGGCSHFFFIRRLRPNIYPSPPKKIQEFQAPPQII